jgi:hypothetical protein
MTMNTRSKLLAALCWTGVGLGLAAFVFYGYVSEADRRQHAVRPGDGCLAFAAPPTITALLNDETDPMTGAQPRRWRAAVDAEVARLPSGSVLLVGAIGAVAPAEMKFETICVPLRGRGTRAEQLRSQFNRRLDDIAERLRTSPPSPKSDISGDILATAADPAFVDAARVQRRIMVSSDLLENARTSAYGPGGMSLPAPHGKPLQGVVIRFTVLRNLRDDRFQTRRLVQSWIDWAGRDAGASAVEVDARWLGFVPPPAPDAPGAAS